MTTGRNGVEHSDRAAAAPRSIARETRRVSKAGTAAKTAMTKGKSARADASVIDFNRSRSKKATAEMPKTKAVANTSQATAREVESQSEREAFARNFRTLRKEAGLSQRDIQKLTGIAQSHLSEIESAMHNICIETMVKLAKLVKRPIHELLKP